MSSVPLVSVVTTVYNAERYIAEAVQSILAQTLSDFEYIIIDDGSTDGSLEILKNLAKKDNRIRLVSRPNTGIVTARNEGLALCRGKYYAAFDADDISAPDRLERQVAYLEAHPEVVAVGSRLQVVDPYGSPLYTTDHKLTHEEIDAELMRGSGWALSQPSEMARRELVQELGGYRKEYEASEDLDLNLRLAERGKLANLPQFLLKWRRHLDSINHTRREKQWNNRKGILAEACQRRGLPPPEEQRIANWTEKPAAEVYNFWGWNALLHGNVNVARKHAVSCLKAAPFNLGSWRLMFCALRGH